VETNVFLAMTPTALPAALKTNAIPAKFLTYSILTAAVLLTAKREPIKILSTDNAFLATKDARFAQEKDNAQDARKDYYFTTVSAIMSAQMDSLLLKANVLLAKTRTVVDAVKTLKAVKFAELLSSSMILNVFLTAQMELTFQRQDAENVILNVRNAQVTTTVLDASLNSNSTTEDAILLAPTEKCLLTTNVSPALIRTARTA